jgi:hypothetical protein
MSTDLTVPAGTYRGFTFAEMVAESNRCREARKAAATNLQSASINGSSYVFGPRQDLTLQQWTDAIYDALAYFDPGKYPPAPANNSAVGFR